jgi:hypothetical protein
MKRLIPVFAAILLWTTPLMAETYSWVDESGTYNFTEDYSRVPQKYRSSVDKRGDMGAEPIAREVVSPPVGAKATTPEAAKDSPAGKTQSPPGSFGGKSYDQWKQEFSDREAAIVGVKKRIDEIDGLLSKSPSDKAQAQSLLIERSKALDQFNEMKKQYNQHAELARQAGIQVNISQ